MAVTATPVFVQTAKITPQNFVQGTDTAGTYKTLYTSGADGSKIVSVVATTDDTTATHVMTLAITRSAVNYVLGACTIPLGSGTNGTTANIDFLAGGSSALIAGLAVDNDGQKYIYLQSGDTLTATFATALTASKRIDVISTAGNF